MKFGKENSFCSCQLNGFGGFLKFLIILISPISLILIIGILVFPLNKWISQFSTIYPIPQNVTRQLGHDLYAQAWISSVGLILTVTWSLKIPYRDQRELMEELNRPPEFNLSIFDAANLKLFESESKNEIFYEIIPFIIQSRKSLKHDSDFCENVVTIFAK